MQRSSSVRDRARRPPSIARLGAAIAAVLAGDATAQTTTPIDDAFAPVGSVVATYVPPQVPGDQYRLRIDAQAGTLAALLITRVAPSSSVNPHLTLDELATATVFPVPLDAHGDLDVAIASPPDVSLESIHAAGLRFRIVFGVPGVAQPLVSDPIDVIAHSSGSSTATSCGTTTTATASASATGPTNGGTSNVGGTSNATTGVASTSTTTLSSSSLSSSITSTQTGSSQTSPTATATTSSGAPAPAANELDSASAPPNPTASKSGIAPTSSYSVPVPTNLNIRLVTQFTFLSATHDQPSPIQGSGH